MALGPVAVVSALVSAGWPSSLLFFRLSARCSLVSSSALLLLRSALSRLPLPLWLTTGSAPLPLTPDHASWASSGSASSPRQSHLSCHQLLYSQTKGVKQKYILYISGLVVYRQYIYNCSSQVDPHLAHGGESSIRSSAPLAWLCSSGLPPLPLSAAEPR